MTLVSKTVLLASTAFLVAAGFLAPTANAQLQTVCSGTIGKGVLTFETADAVDQPIPPIVGQKSVNVKALYQWTAGGSIAPILVTIRADAAKAYVTANPLPAQRALVIDAPNPQNSGGGFREFEFKVIVQFNADAPAFVTTDVIVSMEAAEGTCVTPAEKVEYKLQPKPDFYGIISASVDKAIQKTGQNNQIVFPINIENFGNGQIKVSFEVQGRSERQRGIQVPTPSDETLDSVFQGGKTTKKVVNLNVNTPYKNGYMNVGNTIDVLLTSRSTQQADRPGDTATLSVLVRTQGVYVPGFDSVLLVAALAGAAFLVHAGRRKPE